MFTTHRTADPKIATLQTHPLFAGLKRRDLHDVAALFDVVRVEAGRTVVHQGEYGREFCVLVSGVANVVRDGHRIATLDAGDHFGEMSLFEGRRVASVVAMTDLELLVAHRTAFVSLLDRYPSIGAQVLVSARNRAASLDAVA